MRTNTRKKKPSDFGFVPKEEELYQLPDSWAWTKIGAIADILRGVSYQKGDAQTKPSETNCLILRGGNVQDGKIVDAPDNVYVDKSLVRDSQFLSQGDVVVVSSTGSKKVIGKAASVLTTNNNVSFGAFLTLLRPSSVVNSDFFGLYFQTSTYRNTISALSKGSNINNIKASHLEELHFPIPQKDEQERIVQVLYSFWERIGTVRQLLGDNGHFEELWQSILFKAFRGELDSELAVQGLK